MSLTRNSTLLSVVASMFLPAVAHAQTLPNSTENISVIVNTRFAPENEQDVPTAMSVITASMLETERLYTPMSLNEAASDINITSANPRQTILSIRRIGGTTQNSDGLDSSVGVYEDGVYLGRPGEFSYDLFDIDQVDVQRGPQGALDGRNTTSGAISITTAAPSFTPGVKAQADYGDYGLREYHASVTGPLIDNVLAARLTAYDAKQDGFLYDTALDARENAQNAYGVRAQLLFTPTSTFSYRIIGSYNRSDTPQGVYQYVGNLPVKRGGFDYSASAALVAPGYAPPSDPFARIVDNNGLAFDRSHQAILSGTGTWSIGHGIALTSISAVQTWAFDPTNDADFTALPIATNTNYIDHATQISQELRIASPTHQRITWVGGLYYFRQGLSGSLDTMNDADAWAFNSTLASFANAHPGRAAGLSAALDGFNYLTAESPSKDSYAGYGQASWHITHDWALTGGFRDTYETRRQSVTAFATGNTQLLGCANTGKGCTFDGTTIPAKTAASALSAFRTGAATFGSDDTLLSGLATLSWRPRTDTLLYATYSHGGQGAGLNVSLLAPSLLANGATEVVAPETSDNYELGFKGTYLAGRLLVSADAFWENVFNYQTNAVFLINGASNQALSNAGGIRSRGFEWDTRYKVSDDLSVQGSGSFDEATYTSYNNAPCAPEQTALGASVCSLTNRPVANAPRWILNVAANYSRPISWRMKAYAVANLSYRSGQYLITDDSAAGHIDGYATVDLRGGIRTAGHYDISMWADNLFGANYFTNMQENDGAYLGYIGAPRTFGASLRAEF